MNCTIDGATLWVKKLTSLNPTRFKMISLQKALDEYARYLFTIHDTQIQYLKREDKASAKKWETTSAKSFKNWLRTEI